VDLIESGRSPSGLALLARRLPARVVAPAVALVLLGGLVGVGEVQRAQDEADDVSGVVLRLVIEATTRAGDGSAYGFARVEVSDPDGRPVELQSLELAVRGLQRGNRGTLVRDLLPAPVVVLPLRIGVPDCGELVLPGRVTVQVARPGGVAGTVTATVGDDAAGAGLRRACGLAG
jgi:hypothetical protein